MPFDALLELGARHEREHPEAFDRLVEIPQPDDLAILVYTSGTTGPPKGAMLSHRNILFQLAYADFITPLREGDQQLSFLPLCHIAERTFTVFNPPYSSRCPGSGRSSTRGWPCACARRPGSAASPTSGPSGSGSASRSGGSRAGRCRGAFGWASGWPTSWCSTTSSARSGCTGPAGPPPARPRSPPS